MTRPGYVQVEFPMQEAKGLLARLSPDAVHHSMSANECDAAECGRKRLLQAVKVEGGPGGSSQPFLEAQEEAERQAA